MNQLDLPPRRPLPDEFRDRIRTRVTDGLADTRPNRWRAPLAVAAGVAVLVAGAVLVMPSGDPGGGNRAATQTPTIVDRVPAPAVLSANDPLVTEALDRCGAAVDADARGFEYPPRTAWQPSYGADVNGVLVVPYREDGAKPGACVTTTATVAVTDPSIEPMNLGTDVPGRFQYYGLLYLPESGVLTGFAQHVTSLTVTVTTPQGVRVADVALDDDMFVVNVGTLTNGDKVSTAITYDGGTHTSEFIFDAAKIRHAGVSTTDR